MSSTSTPPLPAITTGPNAASFSPPTIISAPPTMGCTTTDVRRSPKASDSSA